MIHSNESRYWIASPAIKKELLARYKLDSLYLRPFGSFKDDLNIDFTQQLRPYQVTDVLSCCSRDENWRIPEKSFFWELTVGKRIECLLAIVTAGGMAEAAIELHCSNEECKESVEIRLGRDEICSLQKLNETNDSLALDMDGKEISLRKPTGKDQLMWMRMTFENEESAVKQMVSSLICGDLPEQERESIQIPRKMISTIGALMDDIDPLINFKINLICPHCGNEDTYEVDLEEYLLGCLHKSQNDLISVIHNLAYHYHWNEEQVLSVPPWRRSRYLDFIEKEED